MVWVGEVRLEDGVEMGILHLMRRKSRIRMRWTPRTQKTVDCVGLSQSVAVDSR